MQKKYKIVLSILLVILVTPFLFAIKQKTVENTSFEHIVSFSEEDLIFKKINSYDIVSINNGDWISDLGKPMLPIKTINLAIPKDVAIEDIRIITTSSKILPGNFLIFPSQKPLKTSQLQPNQKNFISQTKDVYESENPYPETLVKFIRQSDLAGQSIAEFQIFPLQYIPNQNKLILYTSITFAVEGNREYVYGDYLSPVASESTKKTYERMIKDIVSNPEDIELQVAPKILESTFLPEEGPYEHVIITSEAYSPYYQRLADWHTKKGVRDIIVTTNYIYSNYAGADNQEKIRNFVIDAHDNWGTLYVLLGGEHGTVPFEYRTYEGESIPGDQYYGDIDTIPDWDYEVFVGRCTGEGSEQINRFIDKVLKYERDPPRFNYALNTALLGMDVDFFTPLEELKEIIDGYVPSAFTVTKIYDSYPENHRTAFLSALNSGQNLVNHADHSNWNVMGTGDVNHNWYITNSDVENLNNINHSSVIYSLGCHANEMDYYSDAISERFVIYNDLSGGVAFTGNTRNGFYFEGQPDSLSGTLDKQWWAGLFQQNKYRVGETLAYTKNICPTSNYWKYIQWTLNLLGEPEMPIWTENPKTLEAIHYSSISNGPGEFDVHVQGIGGIGIKEAYVCLWKGDEVYQRNYTDGNGDVTFSIFPITEGEMDITVTKQNYIPSESQTTVISSNTPPYVPSFLFPEDEAIDVERIISLSWVGGDPDPGDTVTYDVYFGEDPEPLLLMGDVIYENYTLPELDYGITYYWKIISEDQYGFETSGPIWSFTTEDYVCGDADNNGLVNIADAVYLIDYIFNGGSEPIPFQAGDVNNDGLVNISDVVYIIDYIFGGGPAPCEPSEKYSAIGEDWTLEQVLDYLQNT